MKRIARKVMSLATVAMVNPVNTRKATMAILTWISLEIARVHSNFRLLRRGNRA